MTERPTVGNSSKLGKSYRNSETQYSKEILWRGYYILLARCICILQAWVDGADVLRDLMLEPWFRLWGGETMFYSEPNELWQVEFFLSIVVGIWFGVPMIGAHFIFFMCNSLKKHELRFFFYTWMFSSVLLGATWIVMIEFEGVGLLRDLSHGDNEGAESMIYVPTLVKYSTSWIRLMILMAMSRQLPLLWYVIAPSKIASHLDHVPSAMPNFVERQFPQSWGSSVEFNFQQFRGTQLSKRNYAKDWSDTLIHERTKFFSVYAIPVLASALFLIDEPRTAFFWRICLGCFYFGITFVWALVYVTHYLVNIWHRYREGSPKTALGV